MSQGFKFKFDQMREGNPTHGGASSGDGSDAQDEAYFAGSNVRNVNFVLANGDEVFLNYAYLVSCRYFIGENKIVMTFTSDAVTLTGIHMKNLHADLRRHIPEQIVCSDPRYNATTEKDKPVVNEIHITNNA
ncbi:hypothetical protein KTO58_08005 [Chitinophaga pendula]|uniref:hypothetical protein n=1 Tax=Chitinophaga TaxID=79328 RepID=UPI000BAF0798|nr:MULTISPECIES: hypothetical protein [Chitinophaga]ASZ13264.1 hypothetical protein CK934_21010 [Chitinophaga sp. MD30]UCJ09114.1 hypothetical protein KTO58_08005 [Chitinophaga pendula]